MSNLVRGAIITLSDYDQEAVKVFVKELKEDFGTGKLRGTKVDQSRGRTTTTIAGTGGEVAFCRLAGIEPDLSIHKVTNYVDAVYRGQNIDVKQTEYIHGHLIIDDKYPPDTNVDICVLMVGKFPVYEYKGWAWKYEIHKEENRKNFGYATSNPYSMHQKYLHGYEIPQKQEELFDR